MILFQKIRILLWKELIGELRAKEMLSTMLVFSLLIVVTFGFTIDLQKEALGKTLPSLIWVTITFAGILGFNRSFTAENDNDCLYGLILCPMDSSAIYFAKTIKNLISLFIVELITVPLFFLLFDYYQSIEVPLLLLVLVLGTYCFSAVGTFIAALTANTKASEILLPILLLPIVIPVLLSAVQVTNFAFGNSITGASFYIRLLITYGIIFTVLPTLFFNYLLEV